MQLKELSARSGTSAASIKYYLREGLLQAGTVVTATRAEYGDQHSDRLQLIHQLRNVVGLSIAQIRTLTAAIDDPAVSLLQLLGRTQSLVLGYDFTDTPEHPRTAVVIERQGWPNVPSDARNALNSFLFRLEDMGLGVSAELVGGYAGAVNSVALQDLGFVFESATRDHAVGRVAVGVYAYSTLLVRLLALAQASHSIRRYREDL